MPKKSYVGELFEFQVGERLAYGLCTHEMEQGWGPYMGQLVCFFEGAEPAPLEDPSKVLDRPVFTTAYAPIPHMLKDNEARKVADVVIPEDLSVPPFMREGGGDLGPYCLANALNPEQPVENSIPEKAIRFVPDLGLIGAGALERIYRFNLTPEREYDIEMGLYVLDEERDAVF
ncbi:hypothetical protein [Ruegeria jejuensis]|uniref:hypothetical protein n=1 Tax=Ruegeria jejuensis TaxID=3233338 RepID=UPI00355B86D0